MAELEERREQAGVDVYLPRADTAEEWLRWAVESRYPGLLLEEWQRTGKLREYPELAALVDVPQEPQWHPEGPVHLHTAYVLDAAAAIAERDGLDAEERAVLVLSALTHDLGKATTTRKRWNGDTWRWTSYGHDTASVPIARLLMERMGLPERIVERVLPLVEQHMAYYPFRDPKVGRKAARRLQERLAPASMDALFRLIEADHSGRPPLPKELPEPARRLRELLRQQNV